MKSSLLLETIKVSDGKAFHIAYHNQRFNYTRKSLFSINKPIDLSTYISPPDNGLYRCRILYDREIKKIEYLPYQPKPMQKIALVSSELTYDFKYADRAALNTLLDDYPECDDILITQEGLLTDTTIANIAFLQEGRWVTPEYPLLKGTTRRRLIDEGFLTPKTIQADEIDGFDGFALMNAMIG
ncbi:MAG: aminotransferase class IV, partial [Campylobacterota bacterium]|nr:aminotransferase class IV [Campylobacterota bacterium]